MASSRSHVDTSYPSLQSIPAQSPTFNRSSCRPLQLTTQHSLVSPKQAKIPFSPRRTVLKLSARKQNVSDLSIFHDKSIKQEEEAPHPSQLHKLPEDIISPFPLQRFTVERQTSNFVVVLLNEIKASKLSLRSITPGLNDIDSAKDKKLKLDVEAILANMKEISSIAPRKTDRSPDTCRSVEVARNTLEEVLEIPLEFLSPNECAKLRKKRRTPSIMSFLENQFAPRLAYRRKSCCCTLCGDVQNLQRDIENNPWVSLLTGWEEHAAARAFLDDMYKKKEKDEPVVRRKKARETLLTPTAARKGLYTKKTSDMTMSSVTVKGISFRDVEDRGIIEARENEEKTPSRRSQITSSKKLRAFLGSSPKTTTAAMSSFGHTKSMRINLTAITPANNQQISSGSNSIVFENEGRLASQASNRNMKTMNNAGQLESGNGERNSFSSRAVSSLYFGNDKSAKLGTERNEEKLQVENRFLGGFITTRSKDSQFSFKSMHSPNKDSIFSRDPNDMNKAVNFTQAVETNHLFNGLVSPAKTKQEKALKGMLKTQSTSFARKVIKVRVEKNKTEKETKVQGESKERELKKINEDKPMKLLKLKSIRSRNKDIMNVYLSTSMRSPSQSRSSPRKLGYTQFPEIKDLSFSKDEPKEKKREKGQVKLKLRKVEEKNVKNISGTLLLNRTLREKEVF